MTDIEVRLNGDPTVVESGTTLAQLVATLTAAPRGVAVAVDATVVPRGAWGLTVLDAGSHVEVLTAVQGG